jgi:hypothetical protein
MIGKPQYELHDGIAIDDVSCHEVTMRVAVGPVDTGREPVCVVLVTYDVISGTVEVVGLAGGWDDDGNNVVLSGIPVGIAQWVRNAPAVVVAGEDSWSDHVQECRDHAVESGYCNARG